MGTGTTVHARKPLRYRLLRVAAWLLLLAAVLAAALWVAVHRCTRPWPARVPVRLEPSRPFLADADVKPDNPFFYLRQLADHRDVLEGWQPPAPPPPPPPAPPKDEMEAMFPDPAAAARAAEWLSQPIFAEETKLAAKGYVSCAYPILEQQLAAAEPALQVLERAAACGHDGQVTTADGPEFELPYLGPLREATRRYAFRLQKRAAAGDWEGVVADTRTVLFCNRQIAKGGPLLNHLVSYACTSITCMSLRRIAADHPIPEPTTQALIALLAEHETHMEPFAEALRYELVAGRGFARLLAGNLPSRYPDRPVPGPFWTGVYLLLGSGERTMARHLTDCFSLVIRDAEMPYSLAPPGQAELGAFIGEPMGWMGRAMWRFGGANMGCLGPEPGGTLHPTWFPLALFRGDPLGRALIAVMAGGTESQREKQVTATATLRGTAISLALRAWSRAHGQPPDDLAALVPEYFAAVPADPCLGATPQPFIYAPAGQGWRLYSVGPDQIDHGGRFNAFQPRPKMPPDQTDLCFHSDEFVPPAEPAPTK